MGYFITSELITLMTGFQITCLQIYLLMNYLLFTLGWGGKPDWVMKCIAWNKASMKALRLFNVILEPRQGHVKQVKWPQFWPARKIKIQDLLSLEMYC